MRSLISFFAVLGVCWGRAQVPSGGLHVEPVIIGGVDGIPGEIPSLLSLQLNGVHHCGATLLESYYALTSALCVYNQNAGALRVVAGLYNLNDYSGNQTVSVASFNTHELFNPTPGGVNDVDYPNDIAILRFSTPITEVAGKIEFARLAVADGNNFAGTTCVIAGWGRVGSSSSYSTILQKASIPVITDAECESALPGFQIWSDQICAQDPPAVRGACDGDFGGPLLCPDFSVGVVVAGVGSWVVKDASKACLPQYPSVYTRVTSYLSWIDLNTP